jgi:hypothetical protein
MDSVYRYMTPIREILTETLGNADMLENMRKRAVSIRRYDGEDAAGREIVDAINYVLDIYSSLGRIVGEIDKKHNNYTKLSVDTIRYHMSADQTIGGKLVEILRAYAGADATAKDAAVGAGADSTARDAAMGDAGTRDGATRTAADAGADTGAGARVVVKQAGGVTGGAVVRQADVLHIMEKHIRAYRQEFVDGGSLWHRNVKSRRSAAEPLAVDTGARLNDEDADRMVKSMRSDYSLSHIVRYMNKLFDGKDTVSTDEIDISEDREFILLLMAAIRAGERNTNFKAHAGTGEFEVNGYVIPQMRFVKK